MNTEMLSFASSVLITSVANDASFQSGQYTVLTYKGLLEIDKLTTFAMLAESYAKNNNSMSLERFFYTLVDLFQLPQEQKKKNLVSFFGELKLIEYAWINYDINIVSNWYTSAVMSKYDFVFSKINVEVKTATGSDLIVSIKHSQLFGS